ncbi:MAG: efflux RND transporter permease subunit [bacterium]
MKLPQTAVNRPYLTLMVFLAIVILGLVSYKMLPIDIMPEVEIPQLTIITIYPGASALNVEQQVTKILENNLGRVPGIKHIDSESKDNVSVIHLQFDYGVNIDEAANETRSVIEFAKNSLPDNAQTPRVMKISSDMFPIIILSVSTDQPFSSLENIVDNQIVNNLKRIPGVANIMVLGLPRRQILIEISPHLLNKYNLTIDQITTVLEAENITVPGGDIDIGTTNWMISIPGEVQSLEELSNIPLGNYLGHLVLLGDVAELKDSLAEQTMIYRSNQNQAVGILISKQTGSNAVEVSREVMEKLKDIEMLIPEGVDIRVILNYAENVVNTLENLRNSLLVAFIAVTLVVLFFLRRFRASLIILATIPVAILITFSGMFFKGYTINIVSLMSLAVAIGMVVDNGIVVLENIDKYRSRGVRGRESSIYGASEMGQAITASSLTTIVVFVPLVFVGGFIGIMFTQLAFVIILTIAASLFTALTLTPMLTSKILSPPSYARKQNKFYKWSDNAFTKLDSIYSTFLSFCLRHKIMVLTAAVILFLISLACIPLIGTDFIPAMDSGEVMVTIKTPPGSNAVSTFQITKNIEEIILENIPELNEYFSITGRTREGLLSVGGFEEGSNMSTTLIKLISIEHRSRSILDICNLLREKIRNIPNIDQLTVSSSSTLMSTLTGGGKDIEIYISGNNLEELNLIALHISEKLKEVKGISDIVTSIDEGKPELTVVIDRIKAARSGLNTLLISSQIRQAVYGQKGSTFEQGGNEYEIYIRYQKQSRQNQSDLENIVLTNLLGQQIRLSEIADIRQSSSPGEIIRHDQQRTISVTTSLSGRSLGEVVSDIENILASIQKSPEVGIRIAGANEEQQETFGDLSLLFPLSILLVYMVMCAQFGSFRDPLVIMFSISFTITGVVLAMLLTGNTLNVITAVGIIMLMGIVVNNGIVLVDYMNLLRKRGLDLYEAVVQGARSRLRPVLMTSLTTILGLLPLAASRSQGYEFWSAFASTAMGGLLVSTFVTLIIVPLIYSLFNRGKIKSERVKND